LSCSRSGSSFFLYYFKLLIALMTCQLDFDLYLSPLPLVPSTISCPSSEVGNSDEYPEIIDFSCSCSCSCSCNK